MSEYSRFVVCFHGVPDPREENRRHLLLDILFIGLCTILCGGEGFTDMEDYGHAKEEWLSEHLELPHGIPTHDTFRRVFGALDPQAFHECLVAWEQALDQEAEGEVVAVDGKTVRRSFDRATGQSALHLVSAWASKKGLALGQMKVADKSNEITAVPVLLDLLDLEGRVVTMDAMGCQRALAEKIVQKKGDYLFCLKGNQERLHEDVQFFFETAQSASFDQVEHRYYQTIEKDHGRIEIRRCWMVEGDAVSWLNPSEPWLGLASIAAIEAERHIGEKVTRETRYFISSLKGNVEQLAEAARSHWGIENSLHYVLDVTLNEDKSRIRKDNAAENLAILRRIALNMLNQARDEKTSVRRSIKKAGWNNACLENLLFR